jgi:RES domain-containing protein
MFVYRLARRKYATDLSGLSANLFGGRWNTPGTSMLYVASTMALAALEVIVHQTSLSKENFVLITIEVPEPLKISEISENDLPKNWRNYPPMDKVRTLGDQWVLSQTSPVLKVPSAIVNSEYNYLLNPKHPDFNQVKIVSIKEFTFAKRPTATQTNQGISTESSLPGKDDQKASTEGKIKEETRKEVAAEKEKAIREQETLLAETKPVNFSFDIFISHASEDKKAIVNPIVEQMKIYGLKYWYDIEQIKWGDSITRKINHGLKNSRFILAVLTINYLNKPWAMQELESVLNKEISLKSTFVLPMLVGSREERQQIIDNIDLLRDKLHIVWNNDPEEIIKKIIQAIAFE